MTKKRGIEKTREYRKRVGTEVLEQQHQAGRAKVDAERLAEQEQDNDDTDPERI